MIAITEEDGHREIKYCYFKTNKDSLLFLLNFSKWLKFYR